MSYEPHPNLHPDAWPRLLRHGDVGTSVAAWQATLEALAYDVRDPVGEFGDGTHNATMAFQQLRNLSVDGVVGHESKSHINARVSNLPLLVDARRLDNIKLVQAKNYTRASRGSGDIDWIVLHSMEGAEAATKAETVSRWFAGLNPRFPAPKSSAHFAIDCDSIVQMVLHKDVAWAAPGANRRGLHFEHAGRARQAEKQWLDAFSEPMLRRSAWLCARNCIQYGIPIRYVTAAELDQGMKGITTHAQVTLSNLSDKGSHTDPGENFPMAWYLSRVSEAHIGLSQG